MSLLLCQHNETRPALLRLLSTFIITIKVGNLHGQWFGWPLVETGSAVLAFIFFGVCSSTLGYIRKYPWLTRRSLLYPHIFSSYPLAEEKMRIYPISSRSLAIEWTGNSQLENSHFSLNSVQFSFPELFNQQKSNNMQVLLQVLVSLTQYM